MVYNKNMKNDLNAKKFRFRYSVWVIILLSLVCAFSAGGIVWNVLSIIKAFGNDSPAATYFVAAALNLSLVALAVWNLAAGYHSVSGKGVFLRTGPFKYHTDINDVYKLVLYEKANKLFLFTLSGKATAVVVAPQKYDEFVAAIREYNRAVIYEVAGNGEPYGDGGAV